MNLSLRSLVGLWLATVTAIAAAEENRVYTLLVPSQAVAAGSAADVQLATLNGSIEAIPLRDPKPVRVVLMLAGKTWPLQLQRRDLDANDGQMIPAGAFELHPYSMTIPPAVGSGIAALEVQLEDGSVVRSAIEITVPSETTRRERTAATQRPTTTLVRAKPAAEALRRMFADRLAPHEPIYFIYGPDDPVAKFQFSFKYKLLDFRELGAQRMVRTLHFAFTQRSLWGITADSSPFYDTSYVPELMYQSLAPLQEDKRGLFTWLGFQAGFRHESNGRDGPQSRSLNVVYARTVFAVGHLDGWHLLAMPEVFGYVSSRENTDISDYRGYGRFSLVLGRNDGPSLAGVVWAGKEFDHLTTQLDLTLPVRTRLLNFETYFLVQYFNGYGESLLSYRTHSETVRAGISLVR